jgi:lipoate synthase
LLVPQTATVLILGNICTRNCRFVLSATASRNRLIRMNPEGVRDGPGMNLKYLVITSRSG